MISQSVGLQTDWLTWLLATLLVLSWVGALPLIIQPLRWQAVLMSLMGLAWLGFGVDIVLRFFVLAYDSVTYGNMTTRLADRPAASVNQTLIVALLYLVVLVAVGCVNRLMPKPKILVGVAHGAERATEKPFVFWTIATMSCVVVVSLSGFPDAFFTPVSLLASLWVFPAAIAWWRRFSGYPIQNWMLVSVLTPGIVRVVFLPYRENLILVAAVPLFAALTAKRRIRFVVVVGAGIIGLVTSTMIISGYRQVQWEGVSTSDAVSQVSLSNWQERPTDAPWSENLRRFHAFDSLLLTVDLVPSIFPYSGRNVFIEGVARGVVPRILWAEKRRSDEGLTFSQTIWAFDDASGGPAAIAPSMPGNLFEAGGILFVGLGAACWAFLLGWIDRVKAAIGAGSAAGIHALFALQALAGTEHDYPHAFSTVLQNLIVLGIVLMIVSRSSASVAARPGAFPRQGYDGKKPVGSVS